MINRGDEAILETDAIIRPLTGIGRYALELVKAFRVSPDIQDLRCFSRGQWRSPEKIVKDSQEMTQPVEMLQNTSPSRWTRNPAKILLKRLLPLLQQQVLRKYGDQYLYHSPNYRLIPFPGRKIATFHDLSLLKFPEFHPLDRRRILIPAIEKAALDADHLITDSEQVRGEIIDYFGLFGMEKHKFKAQKLIGVMIGYAGVLLMVESWQADVVFVISFLSSSRL